MKGRALSVAVERWPISGGFTIARGAKHEAVVVVASIGDGAHLGRGECVPYARYGESVEGVAETIEACGPAIAAGLDRAGLTRLSEEVHHTHLLRLSQQHFKSFDHLVATAFVGSVLLGAVGCSGAHYRDLIFTVNEVFSELLKYFAVSSTREQFAQKFSYCRLLRDRIDTGSEIFEALRRAAPEPRSHTSAYG